MNQAQQVHDSTDLSEQTEQAEPTEPIVVYVGSHAAPCESVLLELDAHGIDYELRDVREHPGSLDYIKSLGYFIPPVVVAGKRHFAGFIPPEISRLAV